MWWCEQTMGPSLAIGGCGGLWSVGRRFRPLRLNISRARRRVGRRHGASYDHSRSTYAFFFSFLACIDRGFKCGVDVFL